jgi:hypothetical protein
MEFMAAAAAAALLVGAWGPTAHHASASARDLLAQQMHQQQLVGLLMVLRSQCAQPRLPMVLGMLLAVLQLLAESSCSAVCLAVLCCSHHRAPNVCTMQTHKQSSTSSLSCECLRNKAVWW